MNHKKNILVVDDEQDARDLHRMILEHEGYEVWEASSGEEALEQIQKMPDLVLLDVRMPPKLTGIEVCRQLKKDKNYQHIPIILSSVLIFEHEIERGLKAGADEYITRPFDYKELLQIVRRYTK